VPRLHLSRRRLTLAIAGIGVLVSLGVASLVPVPYVILSPGPTLNTLGSLGRGKPLIQISGHPVYRASGHLNLVTVSFQGGPSDSFNVFTALQAWLTPHDAVVPEEELFPPGKTAQQVTRQNTQEMASSQQIATAAALCQLGVRFTTVYTVAVVEKGAPASGLLQPGDVITAVDGTPVTCQRDPGSMIRPHPAGATVALTVKRHGAVRTVRLKTVSQAGHSVVGVQVVENYRNFPFSVRIRVGDIGGPSAGLMFALGIIDKLTPGDLTNGKFIAGTGEMLSASGTVGPIGGIQQKLAAARGAGASVFLTPAANCADAVGAVPAGLRLVKVSTLNGAVQALRALAVGQNVPSC
jgi:PDZ domain-containing protein